MPATTAPPRLRRFTVDEYYAMAEAGVFAEDDRLELLDGHIVATSPIGSAHAATVDRLTRLFGVAFGDDVVLRVQNPVRLSDLSEPVPDLALLTPRDDFYADAHPTAEDVLLIVEVADTSLDTDRTTKADLYARHGIAEYWIVDLTDRQVWVHREPAPDGYRTVEAVAPDATLTPLAAPDASLDAADLLPE
jgi:Uma2 family endonuclease